MAGLTIVLPTYNEAENIRTLVPALAVAFSDDALDILVVDDASTDGTAAVARAGAPVARAIVRSDERGLATAVARGIAEARHDWVLVMDADWQHPIEAVRRMWQRAQADDVDVVVGSRYVGGGTDDAFTMYRRIVSRGARLLALVLLPPVRRHHMTDPMSGLFLVDRRCLAGTQLRPHGYKILLEIVARVPLRGVAEIGYRFGGRVAGESKLGARVIAQYVAHVTRLGATHAGNRWFWLLLAALFVGVAAWWLL